MQGHAARTRASHRGSVTAKNALACAAAAKKTRGRLAGRQRVAGSVTWQDHEAVECRVPPEEGFASDRAICLARLELSGPWFDAPAYSPSFVHGLTLRKIRKSSLPAV